MDYSPWFDFSSPKMFVRKVCHCKEYVKRNLMALFQSHSTFIWGATSVCSSDDLYYTCTFLSTLVTPHWKVLLYEH